eukprot:7556428-Alexandrium_andersonii.AAC.1
MSIEPKRSTEPNTTGTETLPDGGGSRALRDRGRHQHRLGAALILLVTLGVLLDAALQVRELLL